jgi:hypothetical protein
MTTVDLLFRYTTPPTESALRALAGTKDVYGIRGLSLDHKTRTLRVEYDATRLNAAAVTKLLRQAGLEIVEELPLPSAPPAAELTPAS